MSKSSTTASQKPFWQIAALTLCLLLAQDFLGNLVADLRDGPLECIAGRIAGWLAHTAGQGPTVAACSAFDTWPQPHHVARLLMALLLVGLILAIARSLWTAYAHAVEVRGEGEVLANGRFTGLVLPISRPLRRGARPPGDWERSLREQIFRIVRGDEALPFGRIGDREVAAENFGLEDLCHPDFEWTLAVALPFRDLAWQQALRVVGRAADSLRTGDTLHVFTAPSLESLAQRETFAALLALAERALRRRVTLRVYPADRAIDLKELRQTSSALSGLVAEVRRAVARDGMIVLDITGGSRAYAAAATLASLGDDVCFAYVVGTPDGGYDVNVYDVAVKRSV